MISEEKINKLIEEYKKYAESNGLKLFNNEIVVRRIIKQILIKEAIYGKRYCPCRMITESMKDNKENICPCSFMKDEIEKNGRCHCGLFIKSND